MSAIARFINGTGWWILWKEPFTKLVHATEGPFATKEKARKRAVARRRQPGFKSTYTLNMGGKHPRNNP